MTDDTKVPRKIKALVVDDDRLQLKLLVKYLESLNCTGKMAENGQKAVDLLKNENFDICFMDIQMPVMDGVEAAKIIKENITKDMPIIAVTSMQEFNYEVSRKFGLDDYLGKPVSLEGLKGVIAKHCR